MFIISRKKNKKRSAGARTGKKHLITENEGLSLKIAEGRYDIKTLREEKERTIREKETAEKQAEETEK